MKLPLTTAEGQNLRSWVTYHSLTSLEDFLMWELDTLQYDAITVCFPSRDTTQPNSLVSLKPNSIRHLVGSHQVPFPMCTLETLQKNIAAQVLYS